MTSPSLSPYYGDLKTGTDYVLQAKVIGYTDVGSGSYSKLTSSEIDYSGKYSYMGHSGKIDLKLSVTGDKSGKISFNGRSSDCTFKVDGDYLYIYFKEGSKSTNLELEWWESGMWVGGDATPYDLWIGKG